MDILGWIIVIALFIIGMAGAIYPILPGLSPFTWRCLFTAGSLHSSITIHGSGLFRPSFWWCSSLPIMRLTPGG